LIQNDPGVASDPKLLGELTDLLSHELDQYEDPKQSKDPRLAQYVALTLGAFQTLEARTERGQSIDPLVPLSRALGPRFDISIRTAAATSLAKQAARLNGKLDDPGAVQALGEAAARGEPALRQVAVYALGFFGGPAATGVLRERVGTDEDRFTRYNAAVALARRGDPAAEATLREMLSTAELEAVIPLETGTEEQNKTVAKQNKIESIELEALEALHAAIRGGSPQLANALRPQLEKLSKSGLVSVRNLAVEVLRGLGIGN
jgi:HEAT repeat protein